MDISCVTGDIIIQFSRLVLDGITSEIKQLEGSVTKLEKQLANTDQDLQDQFQEFLEVST